ncbi:MAG TPA: hypothetical protein VJ742_00710 [Nitrososphaera sp.]|nr:hypothetical protein [Nitrososphaera sp.]
MDEIIIDDSGLLKAIKNARIFSIEKMKDGTFWIQEECDGYFGGTLTKEKLIALSDELRKLAST